VFLYIDELHILLYSKPAAASHNGKLVENKLYDWISVASRHAALSGVPTHSLPSTQVEVLCVATSDSTHRQSGNVCNTA
jgi:hypothetical protein